MERAKDLWHMHIQMLKDAVNARFDEKEPWEIIAVTGSTVLLSVWVYEFLNEDECVITRAKKTIFKIAKLIPSVRDKVNKELSTVQKQFEADVEKRTKNVNFITSLPQTGLNKENIIQILNRNLALSDCDWKKGLASGSVYYYDETLLELVGEVYKRSSYTNPLHPDLFPGLCKMEAEVIRIAANLFRGDENTCGTMTTGGTESIMMACKAYRDYAREVKGIKRPVIIVPTTVHTAFDKAAQYLKFRIKYIPIDPLTAQVNIKAMKRAIDSNTIMLVGSAPNFPYGTIDDISAIADLGVKYDIPVHVDSCLGGFLTCFMEEAGYPTPPCDFRLPGVTSISADTHKYGFTPKGSSVILYRDKKYRHHQYTVTTDWVGGVYGSPTVNGSRAGGNIAVCWAALLNFGLDGYIQATKDIIYTTRYIEKGLRRMKGIFIFGQPGTSVVAIGSNDFEIYRLSDGLSKLGWNLSILQYPSALHLAVTYMHTQTGVADKFLNDVKECLAECLKNPSEPVEGKMALYGVAQKLPDRSIVSDITKLFLDSMYYVPKEENN